MSNHSSDTTVLIHLSDIHFGPRHDDGPLDVDCDLRHEIERDLELEIVARVGGATGILVTGDVAYSGQRENYETASKWLKKLCGVVGCSWPNVWTVPGNHDVDQNVVHGSPVLRDLHSAIRATPEGEISEKIVGYLRDTTMKEALFSPIGEYNLFAGCPYRKRHPHHSSKDQSSIGTNLDRERASVIVVSRSV